MSRMPRVAVLVETTRAFGRGLIEGIANYSRHHGPWSMYFEPQGLGVAPPSWLSNWDGDGILARIDDHAMADAVLATGLPVLDLRGRLPDLPIPFTGSCNKHITKLAFDHLRDRGLRRFGFCGIPIGQIRALDLRRELFIEHVTQAGFQCDVFLGVPKKAAASGKKPQEVAANPLAIDWETEQEAMADWVRQLPKPIGVMACHDPRGYQLIDACRRAGVRVPDDVSVVGVDNDQVLCAMADPPLTSVDPDGPRIGYEAAACLDRMMHGGERPLEPLLWQAKGLVARRSSDTLSVDDPDLREAVRFIRDHSCEGIRVTDVLKHVAMSRSVLERRFRELLGRTPKDEMLRIQLDRARQLLVETDLSMAEIALRSGFASDKYFSDAFWRQTGQRPTFFRSSVRPKGSPRE